MKKILVLGAGRSASTLIHYLLENTANENWQITVGDFDLELALKKVGHHPHGKAIRFDVNDAEARMHAVKECDLVISLLPVPFHPLVARDCLHAKKHLITASYVSPEMRAMDGPAKELGLIFLNEMGVDPGIDHMCAMQVIDRIRKEGGKLLTFLSYCGALIAPEFNNEWGYKFTWAPKNIILAGQGTARYRKDGHTRFIPYNRLFLETERIEIPGYPAFEGYANRDSLSYVEPFGLQDVPNILRGTLRMNGFCKAWNALVKIGLTDDTYRIPDSGKMTWNELMFSYLDRKKGKSEWESVADFLGETIDSPIMKKLEWLELLNHTRLGKENATPAEILQHLLEEKWKFEEADTDMLVQQHIFEYENKTGRHRITSSLVVKGKDHTHTAISSTVGLPAAIGAKLLVQGKIKETGVLIPTTPDLYNPILEELKLFGIEFDEKEERI